MLKRLTRGLVRECARSYIEWHARSGQTVDLELLERQHAAYIEALRAAGLNVGSIAADESRPDCVFIEDTAVVWDGRALITRMAPHREGEQVAVEAALARTHSIVHLPPDAHLEGGDVLHGADKTYVGLSSRTNEAGAKALRHFLTPSGREVIAIRVERCLHLKSAVTWLGGNVFVAARELLPDGPLPFPDVIETAPGEEYPANCLRINDHLLIPAGFPETAAKLELFATAHALKIITLECSELRKGGGSLTCSSIVW